MRPVSALALLLAASSLAPAVSGCYTALTVGSIQGVPHLTVPCTDGGPGLPQRRCETLTVGETTYTYRLYVPAAVAAAAPLLVVLHGAYQDAAGIEDMAGKGFDRRADQIGALVVYPNSARRMWHVDDVGFLRAMVETLRQRYPIDSERIFVTGFSAGGWMTLFLACQSSDLFRGFVAVAANIGEQLAHNCHPPFARPVAMIHGTADPFVPYSGGAKGLFGLGGRSIGAEATFATFRTVAGCSGVESEPAQQSAQGNPPNVLVHRATGCQEGINVVLYEIKGGVHVWPGATLDSRSPMLRGSAPELDATQEAWHFLGLDTIRAQPTPG